MLSQRAALAILLAPFALMTLEWSLREQPSVPCGDPGTGPIRQDWLAGLAPAAFLTGCVYLAWLCAVVLIPGLVAVVEYWGVEFMC
jgi:hypothetical protein